MNLELRKLPLDLENIICEYCHQLNIAAKYSWVIRQIEEMDVIRMHGKLQIMSGYQKRSRSFIYSSLTKYYDI